MKKVVISIGIPGAGKSTILRKFADTNGYELVCPDDIRQRLSGDSANQNVNQEAWNITRELVRGALAEGRTVIVDATFAKPTDRRNFLDYARQSGAEKIQAVFVDVPLEVALNRNASRERQVPPYAVERMNNWLRDNPPSTVEGIESVFILDQEGNMTEVHSVYGEREPIDKR